MDVEKGVMEEIKAWSKQALEAPHPFFNNLPACPYAQTAWANDKVGFCFSYTAKRQGLYSALSQFDDRWDVICYVEFQYEPDAESFHDYIASINHAISMGFFIQKDLWVMGFHPDDAQEEAFDVPFEPVVDDLYAITFIQRLSKLEKSAEMLREKGYYENYLKDPEMAHLWDERQETYRRLCDAGTK